MESYRSSQSNLCANGCGFYGSTSTKNFCSKCYLEEQVITTTATFEKLEIKNKPEKDAPPPVRIYIGQDKCKMCKKKVKIANRFDCRCGFLFCESHRYPEMHRCSFDYKALGEYEIAKANPKLKVDKIQRI